MKNEEAARIMFFRNMEQKQIAEILGVSEKTIGTWKEKGNWKERRIAESSKEKTRTDNLLSILDYNIKCHLLKMKKCEEEGVAIPFDFKELDAVTKLYNTVKSKEVAWETIVSNMTEFTDYLQAINLELAQKIIPISHMFINEKRKV